MTKVYSIDVKVAATAYVRANSRAEALRIAREKIGPMAEVHLVSSGEVEVSGAPFDSKELPEFSLSPVGTAYEPTNTRRVSEV